MDPQLDRLFSSLEAQFGAAIDRSEEEAAADLALSFRQDTSLRDTLLSAGWDAVTQAGRRPVAQVAMDHVWLGASDLVPLAAAIYERGNAGVPDESDLTLLEVLRGEVRRGGRISVDTAERCIAGRVYACSEEHLIIDAQGREIALPLSQVRLIRLSLED